jgi:NADPH:quinone reductase-like Zn-dependent oxidoreductase
VSALAGRETMRAVVWTAYGPPEVLRLQEVGRPAPRDHEVLVEVHAASINSWDDELLRGVAHVTLGGRLRPPRRILGCDISGRVVEVGARVTRLRNCDEVFGDISGSGWGGFAEYVCAGETALAPKPPRMSFEEAAAVPQAGTLALQGLRKGSLGEGQRVLVNGAGGGVGTFAVQIARASGAEVTGVDFAGKLDAVRSLGAEDVVDCTKEDFTRLGRTYDLILDVKADHSVLDYRRALAPRGTCVVVGGRAGPILQVLFLGSWVPGGRKMRLLLLRPDPRDLMRLSGLYEAGNLVPVIDRRFSLAETAEAFRYYRERRFTGKIVIAVRS